MSAKLSLSSRTAGLAAAAALAMAFATPAGAATTTAIVVPGSRPLTTLGSTSEPFPLSEFPLIDSKFYDYANSNVSVLDYPRSVWPLTGLNDPTADESFAIGVANLDAAIKGASGPIVVAALSEGSLVVDREQAKLVNDPTAPPASSLTFIVSGGLGRSTPFSNGVTTYFPIGTVPIFDYTNSRTVESQYDTTVIVGEYDGWADFPDRPWNVLSDLNALAGTSVVHPFSSMADPNSVPAKNIVTTTNSLGATTTTYLVPTTVLPLLGSLTSLGVPQSIVKWLNGALKPLVDAGYSRNDTPGTLSEWMPYLKPTATGFPTIVIPALSGTPLVKTTLPTTATSSTTAKAAAATSTATVATQQQNPTVATFDDTSTSPLTVATIKTASPATSVSTVDTTTAAGTSTNKDQDTSATASDDTTSTPASTAKGKHAAPDSAAPAGDPTSAHVSTHPRIRTDSVRSDGTAATEHVPTGVGAITHEKTSPRAARHDGSVASHGDDSTNHSSSKNRD